MVFELGFMGLGKMGRHMVERLLTKKIKVVVWNRSPEPVRSVARKGAIASSSPSELVKKLFSPKKVVWTMLPAGEITEQYTGQLLQLLSKGDILIDGGNSHFKDTLRRSAQAKSRGIFFVDAGVSGGILALKTGYPLMIGGDASAYTYCKPLFKALSPPDGYAHMGASGSGHYTKMVHNAIEYGMMQSIAEGFELLSSGRFDLDLKKVAGVWNNHCIISSLLLSMAQQALEKGYVHKISPVVEQKGEGKWAAIEAIEMNVPFVVNSAAVYSRMSSQGCGTSFAYKLLSAIRHEFGGHDIQKSGRKK